MIRIVEVGPRDGLQNEKQPVPTAVKKAFIGNLAGSGLTEIEATSFVSPKWVPQLGDATELWPQLPQGPHYSALVPNVKGLERAIECGVDRIAVFTAASDAFTQKNIGMTIDVSLTVFAEVIEKFRAAGGRFVRGYISTAFECPYAGRVTPEAVHRVADRLLALGVDELSFGDTIGVAVPKEVARLTRELLSSVSFSKFAYHFHDTRGTAIANVSTALDHGIEIFDASAGGLGGCPYAPGAGGNVATEDLVYLLERSGYPTGVDLRRLAEASLPVLEAIGQAPLAKAQVAALSSQPAACG